MDTGTPLEAWRQVLFRGVNGDSLHMSTQVIFHNASGYDVTPLTAHVTDGEFVNGFEVRDTIADDQAGAWMIRGGAGALQEAKATCTLKLECYFGGTISYSWQTATTVDGYKAVYSCSVTNPAYKISYILKEGVGPEGTQCDLVVFHLTKA